MRYALALFPLLVLAACAGGNDRAVQPPANPPQTSNAGATTSASFTIAVPAKNAQAASRTPKYISAGTQSIVITLAAVNGTPFSGNASTISGNLTPSNPACSSASGTLICTVSAPAVPGTDTFAVATYDQPQTSASPTTPLGNLLSAATVPVSVVAGQANAPPTPLVLNGEPAALVLSGLPAGTAGTALASPQAFIVTVKDADGDTIVGAYANPVLLTDTDASGATALVTSGSDDPPAGQLRSSSDSAKLTYTGLAIAPATISAAATGATTGSVAFAPVLQPIVTTAPLNGATPEIALTQSTSSGTFNASEIGWSNSPYNKAFTASATGNCSSVGTTAPTSGTVFTVTVAGAPAAASCMVTLSDFSGGSTTAVTLAYVTGTQTFTFTAPGGVQNFTVPFGVTQVVVAAAGAGGGTGNGGATAAGAGGSVTATIPVTAGASLAVFVGGAGGAGNGGGSGAGGFNGGAAGGTTFWAAGGGGASDVRISGARVVVAGGGGGGGFANPGLSPGGAGGSATAASGGGGSGGGGGTTVGVGGSGGAAGPSGGGGGVAGSAGSATQGGAGANGVGCCGEGGGGGGGYFGGGGGGSGGISGGGGGGGSSFVEGSAIGAVTNILGGNSGNGTVTLSW